MADVRLRIVGECVIEVGDRVLTPESSHLFALLLYLCVERGRAVSRSELCELLFPNNPTSAQALHNLRQLLYRLRSMRAPVKTSGSTVTIAGANDVCLIESVAERRPESRSELTTHQLATLPAYEPGISAPFSEWLESLRHRVAAQLRAVLLDDFRAFRHNGDWRTLLKLGGLLTALDEANPEVTSGVAEALAMSGRRVEAIAILDDFITAHSSDSRVTEMRALRTRISKTKPHSGGAHATLHGRHDALSGLKRIWASARNEHPQLSVLIGAPGIGKSRLATEFSTQVALDGGKTLSYRCDASDAERPLAAFSQLVPQMRSMRGALGVSPAMQRCLDLLSADYSASLPLEPAAVEWIRGELPLAINDLAEAVTSEQPLLMVLDDAHLLHSASWGVLNKLCDRRGTASLMVVCCCRGAEMDKVPSNSRALATVISLPALSDTESRAILQELIPAGRYDAAHAEWCVAQATGNPFYLHALAQHDMTSRHDESVPFDIRRLASSSYFGLDDHARALLESCLFLGKFATLRRVREVAGVKGNLLLTTLRSLENQGLVTSTANNLCLSHSLLEEAILPLVPTTVATALHDRVAAHLQAEYDHRGHTVALAWAAADHWLLAGEGSAAVGLLKRCAAQAAALGEPNAATQTLLKIPRAELPPSDRAKILDETIAYAELAADRVLVRTLLGERTSVAGMSGASVGELEALKFRAIEADLQQCAQPARWLPPLWSLLVNERASLDLRIRAGMRLLIGADIVYNEHLAHSVVARLSPLLGSCSDARLCQRVRLITETSFGDPNEALRIMCEIVTEYPRPVLERSILDMWGNVTYALSRLGYFALGNRVSLKNYAFTVQHHLTSDALYNVTILAENAFAEGALDNTAHYLRTANTLLETGEPRTHPTETSYCTIAASLALVQGDIDEVDHFVRRARSASQVSTKSRVRSVFEAIELRTKIERGKFLASDPCYRNLICLYRDHGHLGGLDPIVEALWLAERAMGSAEKASALLLDYLHRRRREITLPEWSLRTTTAADPAWGSVPSARWTACDSLLNQLATLIPEAVGHDESCDIASEYPALSEHRFAAGQGNRKP